MVSREIEPKVLNKVLIPKVIQEKYPNLTDSEVEEVRQTVVADNAMKNSIREVRGARNLFA